MSTKLGAVLELQTIDDERDLLVSRIRQLESLPLDIFLIQMQQVSAPSFALLESFKNFSRTILSLPSELDVVLKQDRL